MAKAKKDSVTATQEPAVSDAPVVTPVELTLSDLQMLGRIVDLASRRGAFQANELSQVGDAYNKLNGFLAYAESMQKKEADEKSEAETPTA